MLDAEKNKEPGLSSVRADRRTGFRNYLLSATRAGVGVALVILLLRRRAPRRFTVLRRRRAPRRLAAFHRRRRGRRSARRLVTLDRGRIPRRIAPLHRRRFAERTPALDRGWRLLRRLL